MADKATKQREEGTNLVPRFDINGLITAMVVDAETLEPLMLAHMNQEALSLTVSTGEAHFYSRSREEIWHKGATSGNVLTVHDIRIDCDQDAVWLSVSIAGHGAACHTGRPSCFYRKIVLKDGIPHLEPTAEQPLFDPQDIYGK